MTMEVEAESLLMAAGLLRRPAYLLKGWYTSNRLRGRAKKKYLKAQKRDAKKPNLKVLKKDQENEEYLLKAGWTKGNYSWSKPHWDYSPHATHYGDGNCYQTLRKAVRIQKKLDSNGD